MFITRPKVLFCDLIELTDSAVKLDCVPKKLTFSTQSADYPKQISAGIVRIVKNLEIGAFLQIKWPLTCQINLVL